MAGNAIVAKLQLDSKDYDKKLEQAKKKTNDFSKGGGAGLTDMVNKFKALAGAVAACKAAQEVFNRVISSSQTIGDSYNRMMEQGKTITNEFVYALANADFTRFTNGLKDIRRRAGEAYDALDQLGNTQISYQYVNAQERSKFREGILTAKDTNLSKEEREAGIAVAEASLARMQETIETLDANTTDYIRKELAKLSDVDVSQVDADALARILSVDASRNAKELRDEIVAKYEEYQRRYAEEVSKYSSRTKTNAYGQIVANFNSDPEKAAANAEALNAEFADIKVLYSGLNIITDDLLNNLSQQKMSVDQQKYAMGELVTQLREAKKVLDTPIKTSTVGSVVVGGASTKTYTYNPGEQKMVGIGDKGSISSVTTIDKPQEQKTYGGLVLPDKLEMPTIPENTDNLAQMTEQTYDAADAMNALSSTMSSLSSIVGEDAAAWLDWGMGVAQAVAQAIPQIAALTTAKTTEATANTASAATGAAASVASVPYVGPILAVAAVASVLAALANLPKFATGGVVPGNMLSGDNVLIRANSGEVVLNREQQDILSKRLNGGLAGKVTFEIKGQKLVGILNNQNRLNSRNYGG